MGGAANPQQGFSLLELMMAVALLSLALIPLLVNQGSSGNNAAILHERTLAFLIADNEVLEAVANERTRAGSKTRVIIQGGIKFRVRRDISELPDSKLSVVAVKVFAFNGDQQLAELTGFHPGKQ